MSSRKIKFTITVLALFSGLFFGSTASAAIGKPVTPAGSSLKTGLVGHWTFDGADWQSSVTTTDKSGNGNDAGRNGGVTKVTGKLGQGLKFDGSSGYMNIIRSATLDINQNEAFSVSTWVKSNGVQFGAAGAIVNQYRAVGSEFGWGLDILTSSNKIRFYLLKQSFAQDTLSADSTVTVSKWYHVVGVSDGVNIKLYIDGVQNGVTTPISFSGATENISKIQIGAIISSVQFLNGTVDDVRVYNRALSATEIQQLYKMGGDKISKTPTNKNLGINRGLVGYWTFDGNDVNATQARDKSGSNNHGTKNGGVSAIKGKIGQAMKFDGTNTQYINTGSSQLGITNAFTTSAWVNTKLSVKYRQWIFGHRNDNNGVNGNLDFILWDSNTSAPNKVYCQLNDGSYHGLSGNTVILPNKWYHVACTYGGSNLRIFVNAVEDVAPSAFVATMANLNAVSQIGAQGTPDAVTSFNGSIDDVRVYNRALSIAEIQQLYKMGGDKISKTPTSKNLGINRGLVGYWTFDKKDITATQGLDISGNGNNGTKYNLTATTGKIGQGLNFTSSTLVIPNSASLDIYGTRNPVTLSAWIKYDHMGNSTYGSLFVHKGLYPTYEYGFAVSAEPSAYFDFRVNQAGAFRLVDYPVSMDKKWHHWTGVYDGYYMKLYQDGLMVSSTTHTGTVNQDTNNLTIGRYAAYNGYEPYGKMDDVRVYNRALSAAEVWQLYVMGK